MEIPNKELLQCIILLGELLLSIKDALDRETRIKIKQLKAQQQFAHFKERRHIKSYIYCKPVKQHRTHNQKRQLYGQPQRSLSS